MANEILASIIEKRTSYSGGHFDALSKVSQTLTSISWENYPSKAFDSLLEKIQGINPEWARYLEENGIAYFVIAEGDSFRASGFSNFSGITCDTEEWYEEIPGRQGAFKGTEENLDQLEEFIAEFARDIVHEVEQYLEANKLSLGDLQAVLAESEAA